MNNKKSIYEFCEKNNLFFNDKGYIASVLNYSPFGLAIIVLISFLTSILDGYDNTTSAIVMLLEMASVIFLTLIILIFQVGFSNIAPLPLNISRKHRILKTEFNQNISLFLLCLSLFISFLFSIVSVIYSFSANSNSYTNWGTIVCLIIVLIFLILFATLWNPYYSVILYQKGKLKLEDTIDTLVRYKVLFKKIHKNALQNQLEELKTLKDKGLITEEEFIKKKKTILGLDDDNKHS